MHEALDELVAQSLRQYAKETLREKWWGKEHDWVNRYAFGYLIKYCTPDGPLYDAGQIGIEVGVLQPPGYTKKGVLRDLVILGQPGTTCWDSEWGAVHHPLAILE